MGSSVCLSSSTGILRGGRMLWHTMGVLVCAWRRRKWTLFGALPFAYFQGCVSQEDGRGEVFKFSYTTTHYEASCIFHWSAVNGTSCCDTVPYNWILLVSSLWDNIRPTLHACVVRALYRGDMYRPRSRLEVAMFALSGYSATFFIRP